MSEHGPELILLRHGETEWSANGRHTGVTDLELTAKGEARAKEAIPLLGPSPFDLILCSPRRRAQRTAELAGLVPYDIDDDLAEWNYGELEGLTTPQIREQYPDWDIWHGPWPGGETAEQVAGRARRAVDRARAAGPGTRVAFVAHGHILRVVATQWLELEVPFGRFFALDTATVSELGWEHAGPAIRRWNVGPS